jgi:FAD/FMN-containing dehydrogenase
MQDTKKRSHSAWPQSAIAVADLRAALKGRVITADDADYDQSRTVFLGGIDRRPALIVRVAGTGDIARVISLANETGLPLAVRSGGHSSAGHSVADGGIVLDLGDMRGLEIDARQRTAWAESGLTAGAYTTAAAAHGLATGFGDTGSVGLGGLTLGGGIGYLVRAFGLTIDSLLAADIVTADGRLLRTDAETHPDLFWAIRGGGGNFGVAARFRFRLHQLDQVVGGLLLLPATPDVIASFIAAADAAPDELSTIANVMPAPPMPFLPAEYHGKLVVMATLVYAGDAASGERAIAPFRGICKPIADLVHPMRYQDLYPPDEGSYHPVASARTMFLDGVNRAVAETMIDHLRASTATMSVMQLRVLGGAMARVPTDATAFAHRTSKIMVNIAAIYPQLDEQATHAAWVHASAAALQQSDGGAYVNFLGDEGTERVRAAYPGAAWDRLAAVKARYDPNNVFRLNQNIPPANGGGRQA